LIFNWSLFRKVKIAFFISYLEGFRFEYLKYRLKQEITWLIALLTQETDFMHTLLLTLRIYIKTRRCLQDGRYRNRWIKSLWGPCSNFLFSLIAVALVTTVVHGVYQLPGESISLETRIRAGEVIPDSEVPLIAEAIAMRTSAVEKSSRIKMCNEIRNYVSCFGIDLKLAKLIYDISKDEQIDPELIFRIIWAESRFEHDCVGLVGEIGLMQVRYSTALTIDPGATRKKLFDPAYNIRIGIKHLKDHLHFYRGDTKLALLAYNRGRGRVNELLGLGINPANGYASKVLNTRL